MSDHAQDNPESLQSLADLEAARSILDKLLQDSRLYTKSKDYKELLDFVVKLRPFAPFNAMLLQLQKPGISYAATAADWRNRFERRPKEGVRPLLILWPFGPVALVYDKEDTEGRDLPEDAFPFVVLGDVSKSALAGFRFRLQEKQIMVYECDSGDRNAGYMRLDYRDDDEKKYSRYTLGLNRNHPPAVQFGTIAHELGHLFLGHLGRDGKLGIPDRLGLDRAQQELEAESVAYIVCERHEVHSKSQTYLADFVTQDTTIGKLDIYQVMRAAGHVESLLGLASRS